MQFRYDFVADKLDLSRFQKQVIKQIDQIHQIDHIIYNLYVLGYKIRVDINSIKNSTAHMIEFIIMEIQRDNDGEIKYYKVIKPTEDLRFKNITDLVKYFEPLSEFGGFQSSSVERTSNMLCTLIKVIYKINNLKAFL